MRNPVAPLQLRSAQHCTQPAAQSLHHASRTGGGVDVTFIAVLLPSPRLRALSKKATMSRGYNHEEDSGDARLQRGGSKPTEIPHQTNGRSTCSLPPAQRQTPRKRRVLHRYQV